MMLCNNFDPHETNYTGRQFTNLVIRDYNMVAKTFNTTRFENVQIINCRFSNCIFDAAIFKSCKILNCTFVACALEFTKFLDTRIIGTDFGETNLGYIQFGTCKLQETNLGQADLSGTVFESTDVSDTCLGGVPNADCKGFRSAGPGLVYGYRTQNSPIMGPSSYYIVGSTYDAPVFSTSDTECHPGLYLFPNIKALIAWDHCGKGIRIIKVRSHRSDIHKAGSKWRTKRFTVVGMTRRTT